MDRLKVESSAFTSVGYDPETQTLEIEFKPRKDGTVKVWQYSPVAPSLYDEMTAEGASMGSIFHGFIRGKVSEVDVTEEQVAA